MEVREAAPSELTAVLNVLDGAALEIEYDHVLAVAYARDVLVAVSGDGEDGTALGALLLDGDHIEAIAVRRNRRGQGIGTALVERAATRRDRLTATFDPAVRPFYEALGFVIKPVTGLALFCARDAFGVKLVLPVWDGQEFTLPRFSDELHVGLGRHLAEQPVGVVEGVLAVVPFDVADGVLDE